jgi:hypothetical protein
VRRWCRRWIEDALADRQPTGKSLEGSTGRLLGLLERQRLSACWATRIGMEWRAPSGPIVGTDVAPEFTPKQNSELTGNGGRTVDDAIHLEIGDKHVADDDWADTCIRARACIRL